MKPPMNLETVLVKLYCALAALHSEEPDPVKRQKYENLFDLIDQIKPENPDVSFKKDENLETIERIVLALEKLSESALGNLPRIIELIQALIELLDRTSGPQL